MVSKLSKNNVRSIFSGLEFDDVRIASAKGELPFANEILKARDEGRLGPLDYLEKTAQTRADIQELFPGAQSVIVVAKNYYTGNHSEHGKDQPKIARYAWGKDYHQWFKKRLRRAKVELQKSLGEEFDVLLFNDLGPVLERSWALKSGMGFIGKSSMFIHRSFGTWTLLGGLITNFPIEADEPYQGPDCGTCTRCMDACPTSAILAPKKVDARKCISTWTIERSLHKDAKDLAPRKQEWAFGCDICQEVCPWNKFQQITNELRFQPEKDRVFLTSETIKGDLRGSPLNRARKPGLRANLLRARKF